MLYLDDVSGCDVGCAGAGAVARPVFVHLLVSSFPLTNENKYFALTISISPPAPCPARGWAAC